MGLQKALKVEAALEKAISEGRVGGGSVANADGSPRCVMGHARVALGLPADWVHFNYEKTCAEMGLRMSREEFSELYKKVWPANDRGDKRKAAAILVGAIKEFCDDD